MSGVETIHAGASLGLPAPWTDQTGTALRRPDGSPLIPQVCSALLTPNMTTAECNAVMLAVSVSGGGTVGMIPGAYSLTDTSSTVCLLLPSNVRLLGSGRSTVLTVHSSVPSGIHAIGTSNQSNVEAAYFVINGNRSRLGAYDGEDDCLGGANTVDPYFHHLWITEAGDCAIDLDQSIRAYIERCWITNCNGNAVHLAGAAGVQYASVVDNYFENCGHARNTAGLANAAGVDVIGIQTVVSRNRIINCYKGVITGVVSGESKAVVEQNQIHGPAGTMNQGIAGDIGTFALDNVISGATSSGIHACAYVARNRVDGGAQNVNCTSSGARVIDNVLTGATSQSVMINSSGITYGRIAGNQMTRNGTKINCNSGSGVVIEQNDFFGTGTAVTGTAVGSMVVRTNP